MSRRGSGRRPPRRRLAVSAVVVAVSFLTLLARLVHLQVAERPAYAARAEANRVRVIPLEVARGRILDRSGRVLADSGAAYRIALDRLVPAADRPPLFARLAPLLALSEADLAARFADPRAERLRPAPLAEDVPADVVVALRERADEFRGVVVETHPLRRYPHGTLAAHVLGTLGGAGTPGRAGASGVEAALNQQLAGHAGAYRLEVDSRGRVVRALAPRPGRPGADVHLTLDLDVQSAAEEALALGIAAARAGGPGRAGRAAPGGAVVALDARDGSVLAMASAPSFDPTALAGRIPAGVWAALHDPAAHSPLTNRALQGTYAPGSTFKPVTALAGLEAGAITAGTVVDDRGTYNLGSRVLRNAQGRAHGRVDLARALAVSSDVYFYALGERLYHITSTEADGPVQAVAARLGLGRRTGVDIGPEAAGRVPGPGWKRLAHDQRPAVFPDARWYPGDAVNLAIGQGDLLVTPLQLATAYAALATGASPPTPHVVAAAGEDPGRGSDGGLDPGGRAAVLAGLVSAVGSPDGTASAAFAGFPLWRVPVAGKTGTAQVTGKSDTSLFVAMAPAGDPRYVVAAVVEEAGFGSVVAAPIVRQVLEVLSGVGGPPR